MSSIINLLFFIVYLPIIFYQTHRIIMNLTLTASGRSTCERSPHLRARYDKFSRIQSTAAARRLRSEFIKLRLVVVAVDLIRRSASDYGCSSGCLPPLASCVTSHGMAPHPPMLQRPKAHMGHHDRL